MRTDEMIQQVRDQMLEFDVDPVTDRAILSRLNFGYTYCYNHLVKSNDSLYARWKYILISSGLSYYTIPKHLWGKRVEAVEAPTPPQTGYEPFNYVPIDRVDPQSISRYDSPRARTLMPMAWTQIRNKIVLVPPPLVASKIRYLVTERPPTLGFVEGIVTEYKGNKLYLDRDQTELRDGLSKVNFNFLSICDYMTGEVKAVYPYDAVGTLSNGQLEVSLSSRLGMSTYYGQDIIKCYSFAVSKLDFNELTNVVTFTTTDTLEGFTVGQKIEVSLENDEGSTFNIVDTLVVDDDFYDRPEYTVADNGLKRSVILTGVTTNTLSWVDDTFVPPFIDGYVNPPGATFTELLTAANNTTWEGQNAVRVELANPHGLEIGSLAKIVFAGTADANLNGTRKCIAEDATKLIVLIPTLAGGWGGAGSATLYQYSSTYVTTGLPQIYDIPVGASPALQVRVSANSPYAFTQKDAQTNNNPEAYDHDNDIQIGDLVVYGFATGVPIIPEPYHQILVEWSSIVAKAGFNESDAETTAILKEMMTDLKGDTAGRKLGVRISKDFGIRSNLLLQSRRLGRR